MQLLTYVWTKSATRSTNVKLELKGSCFRSTAMVLTMSCDFVSIEEMMSLVSEKIEVIEDS